MVVFAFPLRRASLHRTTFGALPSTQVLRALPNMAHRPGVVLVNRWRVTTAVTVPQTPRTLDARPPWVTHPRLPLSVTSEDSGRLSGDGAQVAPPRPG